MDRNDTDCASEEGEPDTDNSGQPGLSSQGVETPEQHAFLLAQHCDEGQGYYSGRPVPPEALAT